MSRHVDEITVRSEEIRAYLDGLMSSDELIEFESKLFCEPALADAVYTERLLRLGMRERVDREHVVRQSFIHALVFRMFAILAGLLAMYGLKSVSTTFDRTAELNIGEEILVLFLPATIAILVYVVRRSKKAR